MADLYNTQYFNVETDPEMRVKEVLEVGYVALGEQGYIPGNQNVRSMISGDIRVRSSRPDTGMQAH